ncbi:choice-of-anchor B family protein [bacterium]|nr:choice-of-anchor B family protein [bacterium]
MPIAVRRSFRSRTFRNAARALLVALSLVAAASPSSAQLFDSDNVVLLSRQELYLGYNDVWGFVGNDSHEYVIQGTTTGTAWWDVQDPTNPVLVKFIEGPFSTWRDMFVIGDYAYVGTEGGGGLQIVHIADPTNPTLVGTYTATVNSCHNIFGDVARELVYVVGGGWPGNGGLQVLDASNPTNLVEIGSWQGQYFHDVSAFGDIVYGSMINVGKLRILDVSDPSNPVTLGGTFPDPSDHASWPLSDGIHVAIASESLGGHIKIVNVSDPDNITLADEHNPDPTASIHNVHVEGTRMYCSWYERGMRIYDVSTPTAIAEIGYIDTFPEDGGLFSGNWGVYPHLPSGTIAVNDRTYGMFLVRYDPDASALEGVITSSEGGGTVDGVEVTLSGALQTMSTDGTGAYRLGTTAGNHDILAAKYGFEDAVVNVNVAAGGVTTTDFVLTKLPHGELTGVVTDSATDLPLPGVELAIPGTPLTAITDSTGTYAFPEVPSMPSATYALDVALPGYGIPLVSVTVVAGSTVTRDLALDPAAVYESFAVAAGWTVQNGPGTDDGFWEIGEPIGKWVNGFPLQPDLDHSPDPEDRCAVTGNQGGAVSNGDVDGGATRLLSPAYDLSALAAPHAVYYRWYGAGGGNDAWETHVSTNGGGSWILIDSTTESEPFWQAVDIDLSGITGSAPSATFRFTCQDPSPDQLVEGALDDFMVYDASNGVVGVTLPSKGAATWSLGQNFPNPFRSGTNVAFSLPRPERVVLAVYDVSGRRVATLLDGVVGEGSHAVAWDGRQADGRPAAAGVYFYRLSTPGESARRKMLLLR